MGKSDIALVRSEMLKWAREIANMPLEVAAKHAHVPPEKLERWEKGRASPTIRQAHLLAHIYQQPFAAFYLPRPPQNKYPKVQDYRKLPKSDKGFVSPELTLQVHKAAERREIVLELFSEKGEFPPVFTLDAKLTDDPENLAVFIREKLGIELSNQFSWRNPDLAFQSWRERIERLGILVFQFEEVSVAEARGFSINDAAFPVIAINKKDASQAKIFSMLHELTHIILHTSGLCDPVGLYQRSERSGVQLEVFCNRLAAEILVPRQSFAQEDLVHKIREGSNWGDRDIYEVSRKYNVSRETLLRRLLTFGLISRDLYRQKRGEYKFENSKKKKRSSGPVHPVIRSISTNGKPYTRLVVEAYQSERITPHDLSNYLDIKSSHIKRLRDTVGI